MTVSVVADITTLVFTELVKQNKMGRITSVEKDGIKIEFKEGTVLVTRKLVEDVAREELDKWLAELLDEYLKLSDDPYDTVFAEMPPKIYVTMHDRRIVLTLCCFEHDFVEDFINELYKYPRRVAKRIVEQFL